mmetsp:Transcript_16731/g.23697  ORF Transcript_16731/g.23697 Transcript_16731/m.23697 type:complete len:254 (+) Transcript_16731:665-1426(+)
MRVILIKDTVVCRLDGVHTRTRWDQYPLLNISSITMWIMSVLRVFKILISSMLMNLNIRGKMKKTKKKCSRTFYITLIHLPFFVNSIAPIPTEVLIFISDERKDPYYPIFETKVIGTILLPLSDFKESPYYLQKDTADVYYDNMAVVFNSFFDTLQKELCELALSDRMENDISDGHLVQKERQLDHTDEYNFMHQEPQILQPELLYDSIELLNPEQDFGINASKESSHLRGFTQNEVQEKMKNDVKRYDIEFY